MMLERNVSLPDVNIATNKVRNVGGGGAVDRKVSISSLFLMLLSSFKSQYIQTFLMLSSSCILDQLALTEQSIEGTCLLPEI